MALPPTRTLSRSVLGYGLFFRLVVASFAVSLVGRVRCYFTRLDLQGSSRTPELSCSPLVWGCCFLKATLTESLPRVTSTRTGDCAYAVRCAELTARAFERVILSHGISLSCLCRVALLNVPGACLVPAALGVSGLAAFRGSDLAVNVLSLCL